MLEQHQPQVLARQLITWITEYWIPGVHQLNPGIL